MGGHRRPGRQPFDPTRAGDDRLASAGATASDPTFLTDLDREPGAVQTLIAASLALLAAGLAPRIFSPGLASVQSAVRERPEIEMVLMIASVLTAGMLLLGGVLGDADGRRRIMLIALGGMVVTGIGGLFFSDGPLFLVGRLVDVACASIVLPVALAGIATRFEGVNRATAIGLAYGAYGAASAAAPVLLTLFGPTGSRALAFAAAAVVAIIAFVFNRRHWRDLPTAGPAQRTAVLITAIWAFGIVVITSGFIGFKGGSADGARVGLVLIGIALVVGGLIVERRRRQAADQGCRCIVVPSRSLSSSGSSSPTRRPRRSSRCPCTSSWSLATAPSCR